MIAINFFSQKFLSSLLIDYNLKYFKSNQKKLLENKKN